jgi:hypothetical protein
MSTKNSSNSESVSDPSIDRDRCSPVLEHAIQTAIRQLDPQSLAQLQVDLEQTMRTPQEVAWLRRVFVEMRIAVRLELEERHAPGDAAGRIAKTAIARAKSD